MIATFWIWLSGFLAGAGVALMCARFFPQRLAIDLRTHSDLTLNVKTDGEDEADEWKRGGK